MEMTLKDASRWVDEFFGLELAFQKKHPSSNHREWFVEFEPLHLDGGGGRSVKSVLDRWSPFDVFTSFFFKAARDSAHALFLLPLRTVAQLARAKFSRILCIQRIVNKQE
jgi:hypothetical protein